MAYVASTGCEFDPQYLHKKPDMVVLTYNPSSRGGRDK